MTPPLVGIMGQKRSGKDTFAEVLTEQHGFTRLAFADPLREALLDLDPFIGIGHLRVSDVAGGKLGWEKVRGTAAGAEIRRLMQEMGMAVRALDPDVWVRTTMRQADYRYRVGEPVVITDVRMPNEADAIREAGGVLLRIERPGLPDDDTHISEHAWRDIVPDRTYLNEGTISDLHRKAHDFIATLRFASV